MSTKDTPSSYGAANTPTTQHKFAGTYNTDDVDHVRISKYL